MPIQMYLQVTDTPQTKMIKLGDKYTRGSTRVRLKYGARWLDYLVLSSSLYYVLRPMLRDLISYMKPPIVEKVYVKLTKNSGEAFNQVVFHTRPTVEAIALVGRVLYDYTLREARVASRVKHTGPPYITKILIMDYYGGELEIQDMDFWFLGSVLVTIPGDPPGCDFNGIIVRGEKLFQRFIEIKDKYLR